MYLNDFSTARKYLLKAKHICPNSAEVSLLMEKLLHREYTYKEKEKIMCQRMMMNFNSSNKEGSLPGKTPFPKDKNALNPKQNDLPWETQLELQNQLKRFALDSTKKEYILPPSLSKEEINFVTDVASCLNFKVKKFYIGLQTGWKVLKEY